MAAPALTLIPTPKASATSSLVAPSFLAAAVCSVIQPSQRSVIATASAINSRVFASRCPGLWLITHGAGCCYLSNTGVGLVRSQQGCEAPSPPPRTSPFRPQQLCVSTPCRAEHQLEMFNGGPG